MATTLRQKRANETRMRIFGAATQLFTEFGYNATTVDRIALLAGVAKGTFFVHFPSKDAVIAELVRIQTRSARKARARVLEAGKGPIEALRATVTELATQASFSRTLSRGVLAATLESHEVGGEISSLFDEVFAEMTADAKAAEKAGLLAGNVDANAFAGSLMASYLGSVLHFASSPGAPPLLDLIRPLIDANIAGATRSEAKRTLTKPPKTLATNRTSGIRRAPRTKGGRT